MSQPAAYVPQHAFVSDSATVANFPGQQLDVEFNDVRITTDQIRTNLALIQRDDGALLNGVVTYDSISGTLQTNGLAPASGWVTGTAYAVGVGVFFNSNLYRCAIAHTSGVFATDLAAGKWTLVTSLPVGNFIRSGSGAPAAGLGVDGDFYIDTAASRLYGAKASGAWGAGVSLIGPTGPINGPGVSVDSEIALFSGTTGATLKRASVTGLLKAASGVLAQAVVGTDYLAPAAIGTTVQAFDAQLASNIPQNSQSAAYGLVLTDGEKHIFHPSADTTARTWTIPANASVAYPLGTAITFINQHSAGVLTISITTDTMRLAGTGATGSRTLAADGIATAIKVTATEWLISGTGLT